MNIEQLIFDGERSEFQKRYPSSCLIVVNGVQYRMEFPSKAELDAIKIVALYQKKHAEGISTEMLERIAQQFDPHADLVKRTSADPVAEVLLNIEAYWTKWREGKGVELYPYKCGN